MKLSAQVARRCLPFHVRIRCENDFVDVTRFRTIHEFLELQLLRPHPINGRENAVKYVIQALERSLFKRDDVERVFDDEDCRNIPGGVLANFTFLRHRNHLADLAVLKVVFEIEERRPERFRRDLGAPEEVEGQSLRRLRSNAREFCKFLNSLLNLGG